MENLSTEKKLELANKQVLELVQANKILEDKMLRLRNVITQLEDSSDKTQLTLAKSQELLVQETQRRITAEKELQGQIHACGILGELLQSLADEAADGTALSTKKERNEKATELMFKLAKLYRLPDSDKKLEEG